MIGKILTGLAVPLTFMLVIGTGLVEYHTLRQLLPNSFVALIIIVSIALAKVLVTYLYRRYKSHPRFSEGTKGLALLSVGLLFVFATTMATVTINSRLYKSKANEAYKAMNVSINDELEVELNNKLKDVNEKIDFYSEKLEAERRNVVRGSFKGPYYKEYSEQLERYEGQRQEIVNQHENRRSDRLRSVDVRLTNLDDKNPVFASFVYSMQDISQGSAYGKAIFVVALIFSLMVETLTITMSNYLGIIFNLYDE